MPIKSFKYEYRNRSWAMSVNHSSTIANDSSPQPSSVSVSVEEQQSKTLPSSEEINVETGYITPPPFSEPLYDWRQPVLAPKREITLMRPTE